MMMMDNNNKALIFFNNVLISKLKMTKKILLVKKNVENIAAFRCR